MTTTRSRRFQFSLRALLVMMTGAAVVAAAWKSAFEVLLVTAGAAFLFLPFWCVVLLPRTPRLSLCQRRIALLGTLLAVLLALCMIGGGELAGVLIYVALLTWLPQVGAVLDLGQPAK